MKIMLLAGSLNQGGAEFQIISLAKLFIDKGHEVEVFALTDHDFYLPFIRTNSIKYTCLKNDQSKIKRIFLTSKKIQDSKPDIIISYLKVVSQVAIVARILSRTKSKVIVGERTSLIKPWHDHYYFNLLLFANHITVNSVSKIDYLKKKFPLLKSRLSFVPNIIDIQKFSPIGIKNSDKTLKIAFVGRISPEKNVLSLVHAAIKLLKDGYEFDLDLYGSTNNKPYSREVSELIENSTYNESINFKGPAVEVNLVYNEIDLLCLISSYEGFSNVLAEALSCGVPVITSDIQENRYLVDDSLNGFLVDPNDVDDIANGIKKFLNLSATEIEKIRKNNRDKAVKLFDKEKIYQKFISIINL